MPREIKPAIRRSRVLEKIRAGKIAYSVKLNVSGQEATEIAAMSGFDCIWSCTEHCPTTLETVKAQAAVCKAHDTDLLVRVPRGGYSEYIRPLDLGATGIMVPHLMSLAEAKEIVYYTKFHPIGRRPLDGGNADGKYCLVDSLDYIKEANEERFVVVQIEDPEPLAELEEICALPGIDMIFFGPADFTQGMGKPCEFADPEVDRVRRLVAKTARKYGKFAGTVGGPANFDELVSMGYTFISTGADVVGLFTYYQDLYAQVKDRDIAEV